MTAPREVAPVRPGPQAGGRVVPRQRPVLPMLFGIACVVRLFACFNDFWFDEVWSWAIARQVTSPLGVLTMPQAQSDNNHPLNTLAMYLIGDTGQWVLYRLPALVGGVVTVWLAVAMARRRSLVEPLLAAILLGLSFPLITYSSEARGYGPMVLCAVGAYWALARFLAEGRPRDAGVFAVLSSLGLMWHLTFLHFLIAAGVWSLVVLLRRGPVRSAAVKWAQLYAVPAIVLAAYWWVFVRKIQVGGAPSGSTLEAVVATLSLTLGGPMAGAGAMVCAGVVAVLIGLAIAWLWRTSRDEAWFFVAVIVGTPAVVLLAHAVVLRQAETIQVRYLLVCVTFALILLARYGGAMFRAGGVRRKVCMGVLGLALLGNGYHVGRFLGEGRGGYRAAVERMARQTPGGVIGVTSDSPERTEMLLSYYKRFLPGGKRIDLVRMERATEPPRWLIVNTLETTGGDAAPVEVRGARYVFDSEYPYYGLSGWAWVLYRLEAAP